MIGAVLVVEDDALVRMAAVAMIEDAGFRVHAAATADEALVIMGREADVSLLFTDVDMPGTMDGLRLTELVHRGGGPDVKLIVASGRVKIRDCDLPDDGRFVQKPYFAAAIRATIDSVTRHPT